MLCEVVETFPAAELRSHESAVPQVDCGAFFDGQPLHFFDDLQEPIYVPILYVKAARAWLEHVAHDVAVTRTHEEVRPPTRENRVDLACLLYTSDAADE